MIEFKKRVWAEIDLDAIKQNIENIRSFTGNTRLIAVIKADGYGHGAVELGHYFQSIGIDFFAVSSLREAMELRQGGIHGNILVLGYTTPDEAEILADNNISQAVYSEAYAAELSETLRPVGKCLKIHIKLNTGMNRIGFNCCGEPKIAEIEKAVTAPGLIFEGLFTHFAAADRDGDPNGTFTQLQYDRFMTVCNALENDGYHPQIRHCCNSAGTLLHPDKQLDAVRPGIIMYGLTPSDGLKLPCALSPAMTFKAVVSMIHPISKAECVSYGLTFKAPRDMLLATITAGYADGYPRYLSNCGEVLIHGHRCPIVGKVCMDQTVVDISNVPDVKEGDEVVMFGSQDGAFLPVEEIAKTGGTVNYEIVCGISRRVPRYYYQNGRRVSVHDYLLKENDGTI